MSKSTQLTKPRVIDLEDEDEGELLEHHDHRLLDFIDTDDDLYVFAFDTKNGRDFFKLPAYNDLTKEEIPLYRIWGILMQDDYTVNKYLPISAIRDKMADLMKKIADKEELPDILDKHITAWDLKNPWWTAERSPPLEYQKRIMNQAKKFLEIPNLYKMSSQYIEDAKARLEDAKKKIDREDEEFDDEISKALKAGKKSGKKAGKKKVEEKNGYKYIGRNFDKLEKLIPEFRKNGGIARNFGIPLIESLKGTFDDLKSLLEGNELTLEQADSVDVNFFIANAWIDGVCPDININDPNIVKDHPSAYVHYIMNHEPIKLKEYLSLPWIDPELSKAERIALKIITNLGKPLAFNWSLMKYGYIKFQDILAWLMLLSRACEVDIRSNTSFNAKRKSIIDLQIASVCFWHLLAKPEFVYLNDLEKDELGENIGRGMSRVRAMLSGEDSNVRLQTEITLADYKNALKEVGKMAAKAGYNVKSWLAEENKKMLDEKIVESKEDEELRLKTVKELEGEAPQQVKKKKATKKTLGISAEPEKEEVVVEAPKVIDIRHPALKARKEADYTDMPLSKLVKHKYQTEADVPDEDIIEYNIEHHRLDMAISEKIPTLFKDPGVVQEEVKKIGGQKGFAFEKVVLANQIAYFMGGEIINLFEGKKTLCSDNPSLKGNSINIGTTSVGLSSATIVDLSTPKCDFEIKYYVGFGNLNKRDLLMPLEKFHSNGFFTYYFDIVGGRVVLYNIFCSVNKKGTTKPIGWVNKEFGKELKFIVAHNTGFVLYDFTNDLTRCVAGGGDEYKLTPQIVAGKKLYILEPGNIGYEITKGSYIDGKEKDLVVIPVERTLSCYFRK